MLALILLASCTPATPPSPTVPPTATPFVISLTGGDGAALAAAVQSAPVGAVISLDGSTYHLDEPLDIINPISLVGAGSEQTMIVLDSTAEYVVRFSGNGPFVVTDIGFRYEGESAADVVLVESGVIAFARCSFSGAQREEEGKAHAGLHLSGESSGTVQDCVSSGNNNTGILLSDYAQPTLRRNVCHDNSGAGIAYVEHSSGTAEENDCSANGLGGIVAAGMSQPTLSANVCNDNGDTGITYFEAGGGTASQNECANNQQYGIFVLSSAVPTLGENDCHDNGVADIEDQRP